RGRGRRRGPGGRPQDGPPHRDEGGGRRAPAARRLPARGRGGCARRARGHAQRGRPARVRGQHARGPGRRAAARARPRPRRVELGPRARRGGRRDDVGGHVHGTPERAVRDVPRATRVPGAARGQEGGRVSSELFELPEPAGPAVRLVAADGVALEPAEHGPATPEPVRPTLSATRIADLLGRPRPTPEQVEVIEAPLEPTLVVAGAGSGKTETMAARVVWLIAHGLVAPDAVLGLTFTRKAAGELAERVQVRLAQLARARGGAASALSLLDRPTVATYNAYAASLVGDHGLRVGVEPGSRLLGEAQQWQLASEVVEGWDDDLGTDRALSTVVAAVLGLSGAPGEHLLEPAEARDRLAGIVEQLDALPLGPRQKARTKEVEKLVGDVAERVRLLDVVAEYRRRKRATDSLDFGDQVALAARLAREVPVVG